MAELRDIFRAEDGSEWHAWVSHFMPEEILWVITPLGPGPSPLFIKQLRYVIEGSYFVWSEKNG